MRIKISPNDVSALILSSSVARATSCLFISYLLQRLTSRSAIFIGLLLIYPNNVGCGFPRPATIGDNDANTAYDAHNGPDVDVLPVSRPSCVQLPLTCGPSESDDCCNSALVPGGQYYRSYDVVGDSSSGNTVYPATVGTFRLDRYEVTVGRFRAFVRAGMGTQSSHPQSGQGAHADMPESGWDSEWNTYLVSSTDALITALKCQPMFQTWTDVPGLNEHKPITCITWYEAMAFCAWDNGFLPTEAEWNYVAAGGNEQRAYPWSVPSRSVIIDGSYASYYDTVVSGCVGDGLAGCTLADLLAVGAKPNGVGRWGQSDLSGNAGEWVLDWYAPYVDPCINCAIVTPASQRVIRGGGMYTVNSEVRTAFRGRVDPAGRFYTVGVRCARSQ